MIAIGCDVAGAERWVTNSQSDHALCEGIAGRLEGLVLEIAARGRRNRESESSR